MPTVCKGKPLFPRNGSSTREGKADVQPTTAQGEPDALRGVQNTKTAQIYATAKSLQSCPTLRDPIDGSPRSSSVPGILQARTLEWVAISFSNAWKWKVKGKSLSCVQLLATPQTAAYQALPSMGVSRQEISIFLLCRLVLLGRARSLEHYLGRPLGSDQIKAALKNKYQTCLTYTSVKL